MHPNMHNWTNIRLLTYINLMTDHCLWDLWWTEIYPHRLIFSKSQRFLGTFIASPKSTIYFHTCLCGFRQGAKWLEKKKASFTKAFSQDKTDYWPKNVQTELNSVSSYQLLFKLQVMKTSTAVGTLWISLSLIKTLLLHAEKEIAQRADTWKSPKE